MGVAQAIRPQGPNAEDLQLMQQVAAEDPRARRIVAMRLAPRVLRLARALLGEAAVADDAAQQVLLQILQGAARFRGDCSLEWWADRITARIALRTSSKQRRWFAVVDSVVDPDRTPAPAPAGLSEALPRPLAGYLERLDRQQREALVLRHAAGCSIPEIAELTAASESTVKYRIEAALKKIRRAVARDRLAGSKEREA